MILISVLDFERFRQGSAEIRHLKELLLIHVIEKPSEWLDHFAPLSFKNNQSTSIGELFHEVHDGLWVVLFGHCPSHPSVEVMNL